MAICITFNVESIAATTNRVQWICNSEIAMLRLVSISLWPKDDVIFLVI